MALSHRVPATIAATLFALPACASYHTYVIDELYSNADGTVQYVVLHEAFGMNGQNMLAGHTLTATHAGQTKTYSFVRDLPGDDMCGYYSCMPSPTAGTRVLIATDGFTALGLVTPDYVVPNGFLPADGGTIDYAGVDTLTFTALPTDGLNALYRDGTTRRNVATNFLGDEGTVALAAVNYQGLWWATGGTEAGWGINLAHPDSRVFATWYTYDTSGKAWWLSMLADRVPGSPNTYAGRINVDIGPPFNAFVGEGKPTDVGSGTLTFTDANNGRLDYTLNAGAGGSAGGAGFKTIARYDLGTGAQPTCMFDPTANLTLATNYQDLWWEADGSQSGWGVNFAHQGNTLFATWYTYDAGGAPLWLSALLKPDGSGGYAGDLLRTSGPRFDNYKASDRRDETVGTATVSFANGNRANFHYETKGSLPVAIQDKTIARYPFAATGGTRCQ